MKANNSLLWLKTRIQDDTPACHAIKRKFSRISVFYVFKSVIHRNMSKNITLNALSATYVVVQSVFLWNLLIKRALARTSSVIFHHRAEYSLFCGILLFRSANSFLKAVQDHLGVLFVLRWIILIESFLCVKTPPHFRASGSYLCRIILPRIYCSCAKRFITSDCCL